MTDLKPGMFGVVDVKGPGGWWIGVGQALAGDSSRYKHAFLVLDADGTILEAEPGGARLANVSEYQGCGMLLSDAPVQAWLATKHPVGDSSGRTVSSAALFGEVDIRKSIVTEARKLVGTKYSWLDYAAIGLLHLHLPGKALRRYVASSGHAQCAQLVDLAYLRAGVHLFSDGREPGDVCPADLAAYAEDQAA